MPISYGKVVGRLVVVRGDGADVDYLPDIVGATSVKVTFTPRVSSFVSADLSALVSIVPVECTIAPGGTMLDGQGREGIWLISGTYSVSFSNRSHADIIIEVTSQYTEQSPLDLSTAVPYVPPPGTTTMTMVVPVGAVNGQVLAWRNGVLSWENVATEGGGGGGANGLSAYELAVQQGYVGTLSQWLASLKGVPGERGIQGIQGIQGLRGLQGANGSDGADGMGVVLVQGSAPAPVVSVPTLLVRY